MRNTKKKTRKVRLSPDRRGRRVLVVDRQLLPEIVIVVRVVGRRRSLLLLRLGRRRGLQLGLLLLEIDELGIEDVGLVALLDALDDLDVVELRQVLVAVVLAALVGPLLGEQSARVDADERAEGYVVETADAPAAGRRLEDLELEVQGVLDHAVQAGLHRALAPGGRDVRCDVAGKILYMGFFFSRMYSNYDLGICSYLKTIVCSIMYSKIY